MSDFFGDASSSNALDAYQRVSRTAKAQGGLTLGPYLTHDFLNDPKRVGFLLARHKFVAKMLHGFGGVLEVGCQEGLGSMIVAQSVRRLVAVDYSREHIAGCCERLGYCLPNVDFRGHDILEGPVRGRFDGAFSLDVIEHIDPGQEPLFMRNMAASLRKHGACVLGSPSLESQQYASAGSQAGHINCKSGEALRELCRRYYHNVFMFGMNDETVHTGFLPMAHYLLAVCVAPRRGNSTTPECEVP